MKTFITLLFLGVALGEAAAAPVAGPPLVHYLRATLHLQRSTARQVQRAVKRAPLAVRTPEQVGERLRPVLTDTQYERYADLQNNVASYQTLRRLAEYR